MLRRQHSRPLLTAHPGPGVEVRLALNPPARESLRQLHLVQVLCLVQVPAHQATSLRRSLCSPTLLQPGQGLVQSLGLSVRSRTHRCLQSPPCLPRFLHQLLSPSRSALQARVVVRIIHLQHLQRLQQAALASRHQVQPINQVQSHPVSRAMVSHLEHNLYPARSHLVVQPLSH
jgi:hypothetical protein